VIIVLIIGGIVGLKISAAQKKKKLEIQKQRIAAQRKKREEELGGGDVQEMPEEEPTLSGDLASFESEVITPMAESEEEILETVESPESQLTMADLQSADAPEDMSQPTPEPSKLEEGVVEHGTIPDTGGVDSIEEDWGLAPPEEQTLEGKELEEKIIEGGSPPDESSQEDIIEESVSETAIESPQESLEIGSDLEFANIENRYNMAQKLVDDGEFEKAIEEYSKISEIESKFKLLSMAQTGICYLKKGDKIKAMDVIKKIPYNDASIDEEIRKELLLHLAHEFEKNNLLKSAIGMYKLAIPLTEVAEKKAILYKIGTLFDENGLTQEAITAYKELYLIDSQYRDVAERLDSLGI
ncbi:hypothetical protein KAU33_09940, partial [Candidatus Dependentiae bacterium]|nr:hypothetical protein [Candidatus Dependentiae bacterium]